MVTLSISIFLKSNLVNELQPSNILSVLLLLIVQLLVSSSDNLEFPLRALLPTTSKPYLVVIFLSLLQNIIQFAYPPNDIYGRLSSSSSLHPSNLRVSKFLKYSSSLNLLTFLLLAKSTLLQASTCS